MAIESRRDVFQAIADPTRRQIIQLISGGSMNVNSIGEHFDISRPAVSQHIKILIECGLVVIHQQGRERFCQPRFESLKEVAGWVVQYRQFWDQKFDQLEQYLAEEAAPKAAKKKSRSKNK